MNFHVFDLFGAVVSVKAVKISEPMALITLTRMLPFSCQT